MAHGHATAEQGTEMFPRRQWQIHDVVQQANAQGRVAQEDGRIVPDVAVTHPNPVEYGAVAAAGINHANARRLDVKGHVVAAHRRIDDHDVVARAAAHANARTGSLRYLRATARNNFETKFARAKLDGAAYSHDRICHDMALLGIAIRHRSEIVAHSAGQGRRRHEQATQRITVMATAPPPPGDGTIPTLAPGVARPATALGAVSQRTSPPPSRAAAPMKAPVATSALVPA